MTSPPERLTTALADRYRLERELGAGGMATVYLGYDTRHDRQVAVKVLRPELAAIIGADRFLAEIKTTAALQHPHLLPLLDSGLALDDSAEPPSRRAAEYLYYVMPLIEGESLRDRLMREKQLPVDDAVRLAREVASALDYAHRHGVIHRDIKPANILLHDGQALVADFGIALAVSTAGGHRLTETGLTLGTPQYMSPEQAMGEREITARSDVYALGAVTYEMLIGDPPFTGSTAQAIVAKVMTEKPAPLARLRETIPEHVEDAVLTALAKLPADRFASAAEFAAALAGRTAAQTSSRSARQVTVSAGPWRKISGLLGVITIGLFGLTMWALTRGVTAPTPLVFDAALPDSAPFAAITATTAYGTSFRNLSVSPAGDFVVYAAPQGDSTLLWYRSLRDARASPIAGTLGGTAPRVSPDGSRVAFLVSGRVMLVPVAGGEPRRLLDSQDPVALEWITSTVLLATHRNGSHLSWLDPEVGQTRAKAIPRCSFGHWIPEDRQLICGPYGTAIVVAPESGERWTIRSARPDGSPGRPLTGSAFRIVDGSYLLYLSGDGDLRAAPYNRDSHLIGRSVTLLTGVRRETIGDAQYDLTTSGTLVFAPGANAEVARMVRLSRRGAPEPFPLEPAAFLRYDLSRDGRWLAVVVQTVDGQELRIHDLRDGQRLSWFRAEWIGHPMWSPNGDRLLVSVQDSSRSSILLGTPSSGVAPDTLFAVDAAVVAPDPIDFHDDRVVLVHDRIGFVTRRFDPSAHPVRFDTVITDSRFSSISPDGRHLAYNSVPCCRVIVTSYPAAGPRWQLSSDGVEPIWLSSLEVLYRSGVSWYVARLDPATGEPVGAATFWGRDPQFSDTWGWSNRLAHDGGIIYVQGPAQTSTSHLRIVPNWVAQMKVAVDGANQ